MNTQPGLTARLLRGALLTVAVAGFTLLTPWALIRYIGWPLPASLPTRDQVTIAINSLPNLPGDFLINLFACGIWLCWVTFTIGLARATIAITRDLAHGKAITPIGPLQTLAAAMIGATLATIHSTPAAATAPVPATAPQQPGTRTAVPAAAEHSTSTPREDQHPADMQTRTSRIRFDFDSAQLNESARQRLNDTVAFIQRYAEPGTTITITGHADSTGPADYNQHLSERRARTVADALKTTPLPEHHDTHVAGRGETEPLENDTYANGEPNLSAHASNRRVELTYTLKTPPPASRADSPQESPPPLDEASPSTTGPGPSDHDAVRPPSGGSALPIGAFAAGIAAGLAATRLHRRLRRRARPTPTPIPVLQPEGRLDESTTPPVPGSSISGIEDLLMACPSIVVGGEGAVDAVRALLKDFLDTSPGAGAAVIDQPAGDLLLGHADGPDRPAEVETAASTAAALRSAHAQLLRRTADTPDDEDAQADLSVLVIAMADADSHDELEGLIDQGAGRGLRAIMFSEQENARDLTVASDGTITSHTHMPLFEGGRLPLLGLDALRQDLHRAGPASDSADTEIPLDTEAAPAGPPHHEKLGEAATPGDQAADEKPVRLVVLGAVGLFVGGEPVRSGVRRPAYHLATYLALHPDDGVRLETAIADLWPEEPEEKATKRFHDAVGSLRRAARPALPEEQQLVVRHNDTYFLNAEVTDVDLWRFEAAMRNAEIDDEAQRLQALQNAANSYTGDLADDRYEWATGVTQFLHDKAVSACTGIAEITEADEPERALSALERAISFDPYAEGLYCWIMRIQKRQGRPDAVQRAYQRLTERLNEIDASPEEATKRLATSAAPT